MAFLNLTLLLLLITISCFTQIMVKVVEGQVDDTSLTLEWPSTNSLYSSYPTYPLGGEEDGEDSEGFGDEAATTKNSRRALFWHRIHYYISYGALSANRIPCPPRSGRSYYTHHCYRARGPVHPYSRGCSAITRCRR